MSLALSSIDVTHIEKLSSAKKEPDWLKEYRQKSLSIYHEMPLEVSPLYNKYTDARKLYPEQVLLSTSSDSAIPDFLKKRFAELENELDHADREHELEAPVGGKLCADGANDLDAIAEVRGVLSEDLHTRRRLEGDDVLYSRIDQHADDPARTAADVRYVGTLQRVQ